jgi:hypothetical protein
MAAQYGRDPVRIGVLPAQLVHQLAGCAADAAHVRVYRSTIHRYMHVAASGGWERQAIACRESGDGRPCG